MTSMRPKYNSISMALRDARITAQWNSVSARANSSWPPASCRFVAAAQQCTQHGDVIVGAVGGGQSRALDFQTPTYLQHVAQFGAAQPTQRAGYLAGGPDIGPVTLTHLEQAGMSQSSDRFAHGVAAHTQRVDQVAFVRDAVPDRPIAAGHRSPELFDHLVDQARTAGCAQRHTDILSTNHGMLALYPR